MSHTPRQCYTYAMGKRLIELSVIFAVCAVLLAPSPHSREPKSTTNPEVSVPTSYPIGQNALLRRTPAKTQPVQLEKAERQEIDWHQFWAPYGRNPELDAQSGFRKNLRPLPQNLVPFSIGGVYPGMSAAAFNTLYDAEADSCTTNWGCRRSCDGVDVYHAIGPESTIVAVRGSFLEWNGQQAVRPGMDKSQVLAALGPPSAKENWETTRGHRSHPVSDWTYHLPPVSLEVQFRDDRVVSVFIYRTGASGPSRC
jgi:hypothetical protein